MLPKPSLGYSISKGTLQPNPVRVEPVLDIPVPCNAKELQRMLGMFSYYTKWIPRYSEKIKPLVVLKVPSEWWGIACFNYVKNISFFSHSWRDWWSSVTLETDASDNAISATLMNQQGDRPVDFFSRMLNKRKLHYSSVKKGALAIIETVWKWEHFLTGRHFTVVTDQWSVSFVYSGENRRKIRNDKVLRWRMELNEFAFYIVYRSGKLNSAPDALSRVYCASMHARTV